MMLASGLKPSAWPETKGALERKVSAAKQLRAEYA